VTSPTAVSAELARQVAAAVVDPELPMLTIADLGILRGVEVAEDGTVVVTITPTYSGCPALAAIRTDLGNALTEAGFRGVTVRTRLTPAWSTNDITPAGRSALADAGVAPPDRTARPTGSVVIPLSVRCPSCGSLDTSELSRFGSTACTSLWRCRHCGEPFGHVKPF
jgi:ring-1,2-phenylacetyl-CoA epoxidase subunit PaaD